MNDDYKTTIVNEIISGALFDEEYSVDSSKHFALAPKDVVKIGMQEYIQDLISNIKTVRAATYGQVEIDDVTGEVTVNGKPQASTASTNDETQSSDSSEVSPSSKNDILEFLKLLKSNGVLDKLKNVDSDTKKKMADKILKALTVKPSKPRVKKTSTPSSSTPDPEDQLKNMPVDISEELLLKEAYIILTELDVTKKPSTTPTPAASTTPPTPTPAPATPASSSTTPTATPTATSPTPSTDTPPSKPEDKSTEDKVDVNSAKIVDVIKNPKKYGIDPATDEVFKKKSQYVNKLENDYKNLSKIPGATKNDILAIVKSVDDATGEVEIELFKKESTNPNGKANYNVTGQVFKIPQETVLQRMPAEQVKKKGLFSKIFSGGWGED
jgi:hypothetical protein